MTVIAFKTDGSIATTTRKHSNPLAQGQSVGAFR